MKLYATVTSERASKGQGGNDFIDVVISDGGQDEPRQLMRINVDSKRKTINILKPSHKMAGTALEIDYRYTINSETLPFKDEQNDQQKGKRQKGDELDIAFHRVNADER